MGESSGKSFYGWSLRWSRFVIHFEDAELGTSLDDYPMSWAHQPSTVITDYRSTTRGRVVEGEGTDVAGMMHQMKHQVVDQVAGQVIFF